MGGWYVLAKATICDEIDCSGLGFIDDAVIELASLYKEVRAAVNDASGLLSEGFLS